MPKRNTTSVDKARQALAKAIRSESRRAAKSLKSLSKAATKKAAQIKRAREDEYIARWRILKKLGLIATKKPPAKKRLNSKTKTKINKEFYALQENGHFAKGRVNRPLKKVSYKTRGGKSKEKYELSEYFKPIKTKKKTSAKSGVIKTRKGYIVELERPDTKVRINNKGELVEKTNGRVRRRSSYKGKQTLTLIKQIENGSFKLKKNELLVFPLWGHSSYERRYYNDTLDDFVKEMRAYEKQMIKRAFDDLLDTSEIYFEEE